MLENFFCNFKPSIIMKFSGARHCAGLHWKIGDWIADNREIDRSYLMSANLDVQMRASYEKAPSAVMVTVYLTPIDKIINERANKTATQKQTGRAIRKVGERVKNVFMCFLRRSRPGYSTTNWLTRDEVKLLDEWLRFGLTGLLESSVVVEVNHHVIVVG